MGHRSCIVRHRPTTLPGAPSRTRAHRRPGRADKKRGSPRSPRSSTTYVIIVLEGRRPGESIDAALRSLVLLDDGSIVGHFRSIFILSGFDESLRPRERLTVGPIDRSTTTTVVFDAESRKSINEFVESSVYGQQTRAVGIPDKYQACESISEFEAHSRVLEEPGRPSTSGTLVADRAFGSIDTLIPSSIASLLVRSYSIRLVNSIWKNNRINRLTGIVDPENRFPIIARPIFSFCRLVNEQTITRVRHLSILLSGSINQFFQPAIPKTIEPYKTIDSSSSSSSRGLLILTATLFRAAAMTFRRRTSLR